MPAPTGSPTSVNTIGDGLRRVLRGLRGRLLAREDQIDARLDERLGGDGHRVQLALREPDVERHVTAVLEAELLEAGLEPLDGRMARGVRGVEDADAERAPSLLRLRGSRERRREQSPTATQNRRGVSRSRPLGVRRDITLASIAPDGLQG